MRSAARMPMIATTISSSMRVNPLIFLIIENLLEIPWLISSAGLSCQS
jgi:hypothetical protein